MTIQCGLVRYKDGYIRESPLFACLKFEYSRAEYVERATIIYFGTCWCTRHVLFVANNAPRLLHSTPSVPARLHSSRLCRLLFCKAQLSAPKQKCLPPTALRVMVSWKEGTAAAINESTPFSLPASLLWNGLKDTTTSRILPLTSRLGIPLNVMKLGTVLVELGPEHLRYKTYMPQFCPPMSISTRRRFVKTSMHLSAMSSSVVLMAKTLIHYN